MRASHVKKSDSDMGPAKVKEDAIGEQVMTIMSAW
jgi:hypothetical protein